MQINILITFHYIITLGFTPVNWINQITLITRCVCVCAHVQIPLPSLALAPYTLSRS